MATRSRIGIIGEIETITSVYCHNDGYPDYLGNMLIENYNSKEKAELIISMGGISVLRKEIGEKADDHKVGLMKEDYTYHHPTWSLFYHRDRDEDLQIAKTNSHHEFFELCGDSGSEFIYLWNSNKWVMSETNKHYKPKITKISDWPKINEFIQLYIMELANE